MSPKTAELRRGVSTVGVSILGGDVIVAALVLMSLSAKKPTPRAKTATGTTLTISPFDPFPLYWISCQKAMNAKRNEIAIRYSVAFVKVMNSRRVFISLSSCFLLGSIGGRHKR